MDFYIWRLFSPFKCMTWAFFPYWSEVLPTHKVIKYFWASPDQSFQSNHVRVTGRVGAGAAEGKVRCKVYKWTYKDFHSVAIMLHVKKLLAQLKGLFMGWRLLSLVFATQHSLTLLLVKTAPIFPLGNHVLWVELMPINRMRLNWSYPN